MAHDQIGAEERSLDRRLWASVVLNLVITLAETAGGLLSGSLALLSDAAHNLSDVAALALALLARHLGRRAPSVRFTYGLKRVEVLVAVVNAAVLLLVTLLIVIEAIRHLRHPSPIAAGPMLAVALGAFLANAVSVWLLRSHHHDDLNVRSAFLHLFQDALASLAVLIAALFARTEAGPYLDAIAALLIGVIVVRSAVSILWEAVQTLVEAAPAGLDVNAVAASVEEAFAPSSLHHIHVWTVGPGQIALTAHLRVPEMPVSRAESAAADIRRFLRTRWGVEHATLEPEVSSCGQPGVLGVWERQERDPPVPAPPGSRGRRE